MSYDNFKKQISEKVYYVDKIMVIREILENKDEVNLFTRPRRFGKAMTHKYTPTFLNKKYCKKIYLQTTVIILREHKLSWQMTVCRQTQLLSWRKCYMKYKNEK